MKKTALFALLILMFTSCSKQNNWLTIDTRTINRNGTSKTDDGTTPPCTSTKFVGNWKVVNWKKYNWALMDTAKITISKDSLRLIFPAQTRVNKIEIYWKGLQNCQYNIFKLDFDGIPDKISQNVTFSHDTLVNYIITDKGDTSGIKWYVKY